MFNESRTTAFSRTFMAKRIYRVSRADVSANAVSVSHFYVYRTPAERHFVALYLPSLPPLPTPSASNSLDFFRPLLPLPCSRSSWMSTAVAGCFSPLYFRPLSYLDSAVDSFFAIRSARKDRYCPTRARVKSLCECHVDELVSSSRVIKGDSPRQEGTAHVLGKCTGKI